MKKIQNLLRKQRLALLALGSAATLIGFDACAQTTPAPQPSICTRSCWSARNGTCTTTMSSLTRAIIHHTAGASDFTTDYETAKARVRNVQNYHMDNNAWCDIGYHFMVSNGGHIFEGRKGSMTSLIKGNHAGCGNVNSFGFTLLGYFHSPYNHSPSAAMQDAIYDVIAWRMPSGWSPYGGRTAYSGSLNGTAAPLDTHAWVGAWNGSTCAGTACPGSIMINNFITSDFNGGPMRTGIAQRRTPSAGSAWYFSNGTDGWAAINGTTGLGWVNDATWPGVIYADQIANDAYWFSPATSFSGTSDASVNVSVYPQSGTSSSHDMKVYWKTSAENFWDEAKSTPLVTYNRKDAWIRLNLNCSNAKFSGQTVNQIRLDFDGTSKGTRWIVNHVIAQQTPKYWFGSGASGWTAGNGLSGFNWTATGWPGIIYADQVADDAWFTGPGNLAYLGGANDQIVVRVYIQNASSSSHDMQLFWTTAADSSWTESKSVYVPFTLANDTWADIVLPVGKNANWINSHVMQMRLDVDNVRKGSPRWLIDYIVISHTTSSLQ